MRTSRRSAFRLIAGLTAAAAATPLAALAEAPASTPASSRLHLLGTGGGPVVGAERGMACNAISVGDRVYVVDCGYGAVEALVKAGIPLRQISSILITHNHADHLLDYGSLLFLCWLQGRVQKMDVYGPPPLAAMTRAILTANSTPLDYYREDMGMAGMPPVDVHEQSQAGLVFSDDRVKVRSTLVKHPPVHPALAYRFDLPDRSIVFSGDTAPTEEMVKLAEGADILVHEATIVDAMLGMMSGAAQAQGRSRQDGAAQPQAYDAAKFKEHVLMAHSSAAEAGRIAAAAGVGTLVLNHLAPSSGQIVSDGEWISHARQHFKGQIIVAHDGMVL